MKILLIEDNPGDARLIQEMLKTAPGNFTIDVVEKLGLGLEFLASQDVDVVLLDPGLPDSRGLETLIRLRAKFPHIPVVIMTGSGDEAIGVKAVQLGAQDYLVKGQVDSRLLQRALTYAIERRKMEIQLFNYEKLAYLGRMAGTIAHEVRNSLAVVHSSAFYLERTLKDAEDNVRKHLSRMREGVDRTSAIIEKLLEMSRMRQPDLRPVDLSRFMTGVVSSAEVPANIKVALNEWGEGIAVMADEELLRMAIGNLLRNAIEAMTQGGTLTISVRNVDNQAEVSVKDTGAGVLPVNLSRLFEPFFTTKQGGVGFGLALVKTIVEKHNGKIEVKSEPGAGATFTISLPFYSER